ncbi:MAG: hypothetical protein JRD89_01370 [Deltaproteobacteria bacterium]|nr:hypothetical protein [Deltaproteobacteria bacterium]
MSFLEYLAPHIGFLILGILIGFRLGFGDSIPQPPPCGTYAQLLEVSKITPQEYLDGKRPHDVILTHAQCDLLHAPEGFVHSTGGTYKDARGNSWAKVDDKWVTVSPPPYDTFAVSLSPGTFFSRRVSGYLLTCNLTEDSRAMYCTYGAKK